MLAGPAGGSLGVVGEPRQPATMTGPMRSMLRGAIAEEIGGRAMAAMQEAERKREERAMWARGDYHAIARGMFWDVGARIVDRLGVKPGERVLDVACGSGNAAIRAAGAGGRVVGVDLTPELLDVGRRLAADAGLDVEWAAGDAEALPLDDGSFDVVLSTFGCMFAPRHELAARELARVLRPGGRLGLCSWTPGSSLAELGRIVIANLPPPPEPSQPPFLWGSEEHVRALFAGTGVELRFAHETVEFRFDSLERALDAYETDWGPFVTARERLEPEGRWAAVRAELADVLERHGKATGAEFIYGGEYLVVEGSRR
jgi:SAM-dependent methyltransferase